VFVAVERDSGAPDGGDVASQPVGDLGVEPV
jgi:hypothetical protein